MPNIKNQVKRVITNEKRAVRNKATKSSIKTAMKNVYKFVEEGDKEKANEALKRAHKLLDLSVDRNLHHRNYVSRHKSRLAKAVNTLE